MGLDLRYIHDINQAKVVKTYIYVFFSKPSSTNINSN